VGVTAEGTTSVTVGRVFTGGRVGECPYEDGTVTGGRKDEVGVFGSSGDGSDPVGMTG